MFQAHEGVHLSGGYLHWICILCIEVTPGLFGICEHTQIILLGGPLLQVPHDPDIIVLLADDGLPLLSPLGKL